MHSIEIFFNPSSFAVIGASDNPKKGGNIVIQNLHEFGWQGTICPVNPRGGTILNHKAYPSVCDVPGDLELAMMVIPRDLVPKAMDECGRKGVRGVIISTAGFSDSGDEVGRRLEREVVDIATRYRMRLMGPNSIGTVNVKDGFVTSITTLTKPDRGDRLLFRADGNVRLRILPMDNLLAELLRGQGRLPGQQGRRGRGRDPLVSGGRSGYRCGGRSISRGSGTAGASWRRSAPFRKRNRSSPSSRAGPSGGPTRSLRTPEASPARTVSTTAFSLPSGLPAPPILTGSMTPSRSSRSAASRAAGASEWSPSPGWGAC